MLNALLGMIEEIYIHQRSTIYGLHLQEKKIVICFPQPFLTSLNYHDLKQLDMEVSALTEAS